jgi:hypothetical protein
LIVSLSNGTSGMFDQVVAALEKGPVVKLTGEKTGAQIVTLANPHKAESTALSKDKENEMRRAAGLKPLL